MDLTLYYQKEYTDSLVSVAWGGGGCLMAGLIFQLHINRLIQSFGVRFEQTTGIRYSFNLQGKSAYILIFTFYI